MRRATLFSSDGETYVVVSIPVAPPATESASWGDTLTKAEREVATLIIQGLSNAAIARARGSATRTVANQVAAILRKLRAESRADVLAKWVSGRAARSPGHDGAAAAWSICP